jgi:CRP-like cAMP-binding protein
MRNKPTAKFDAKAFLTKAGTGRSVSVYRKKQVVFTQGDRADSVFYLERGQIKLAVASSETQEARHWAAARFCSRTMNPSSILAPSARTPVAMQCVF